MLLSLSGDRGAVTESVNMQTADQGGSVGAEMTKPPPVLLRAPVLSHQPVYPPGGCVAHTRAACGEILTLITVVLADKATNRFDLRKEYWWPTKRHMKIKTQIATLALLMLLASCASYGPYHPNTSAEPLNSVRGPKDGRYKLAIIEFGDQGSAFDTSQRAAALGMIREAARPLLFVYIHGWQNNADSGDVCRFGTSSIRSRVFRRSRGERLM